MVDTIDKMHENLQRIEEMLGGGLEERVGPVAPEILPVLRGMLNRDASARWTARQTLQHPFFTLTDIEG